MDRRNFFVNSAAAGIATALVSHGAQAADGSPLPPKNLVLTDENPGDFAGRRATHLPRIEVAGSKVKVVTRHGHSAEHFIVRHTLLLADGSLLGAKTFTGDVEPASEYDLPAGYKGKIYATSFCNLHDLWLAEATV
ncbi:desulfoferrodoxin family protein [Derxia lacustris]|uniref:desulfoferrodoxin family protein n=1 Tax=Derxia lacustris TaxID=764842 RepID=UPI000A173462|nr:desulfoferrodoxin family protein [Derxia lacustris]